MQRLWYQIIRNGGLLSIEDYYTKSAMEKISDHMAVAITGIYRLKDMVQMHCTSESRFQVGKQHILSFNLAVMMRKDLDINIKNTLNKCVSSFFETGFTLKALQGEPKTKDCDVIMKLDEEITPLKLKDFSLAFKSCFAGYIMSFVCLLIELSCSYYKP